MVLNMMIDARMSYTICIVEHWLFDLAVSQGSFDAGSGGRLGKLVIKWHPKEVRAWKHVPKPKEERAEK